jgi:chorismate synthase
MFGQQIKISLFGESHGKMIGITIHHLPAGLRLPIKRMSDLLTRRRGDESLSTPRREPDPFEIVTGYFKGRTTGAPLTIMIPNKDTRSKDYTPEILRPSHADLTSHEKYSGHQDYRGSGHFSGRLTAMIVILGAIAEDILSKRGILIGSHLASIHQHQDDPFPLNISDDLIQRLNQSRFPLINQANEDVFKETILQAKAQKDSVGGTVETAIINMPRGYGEPFFDSMESILSHLIFSVPAVKGIEFGEGFNITKLYGSEANDPIRIEDGKITMTKNNSGGIQGGITNGMPITFKVAIKPTASIGKPQQTVNLKTQKNTTLELVGRHDPSIVPRVLPVINAITAYAVLEMICRNEGTSWMI